MKRKWIIILIIALSLVVAGIVTVSVVKDYKEPLPVYYSYFWQQGGYTNVTSYYFFYQRDEKYFVTVNGEETYKLSRYQYKKSIPTIEELDEIYNAKSESGLGCGTTRYTVSIRYHGEKEISYDFGSNPKAGDLYTKFAEVLAIARH